LHDIHGGWFLGTGVMHESANRGEARVASANAVVTVFLQVFEELQNERSVQVLQRKAGRSFP
jgi:hypothetical protein